MDSHNTKATKHRPSSSELLSSAKLVADAAKATLSHDKTHNVDKAKVAGAAGNLLEAASHYGHLEEKSYGKYVQKAENYLHQYHSSHSTTTTTSSGHSSPPPPTATTHSSSHSSGKDEDSGPGFGDYLKMAQGFMKKN